MSEREEPKLYDTVTGETVSYRVTNGGLEECEPKDMRKGDTFVVVGPNAPPGILTMLSDPVQLGPSFFNIECEGDDTMPDLVRLLLEEKLRQRKINKQTDTGVH